MATTGSNTGRATARTGARAATNGSGGTERAKVPMATDAGTITRARAGRKIQKKMPVIWEDGSVKRPAARGSKGIQPAPAKGPITSRLPLSRGTDGLATVATSAVGEFWEKFHYYHQLQAELENLYLWFEEFEQTLHRDNGELEMILAGVQARHRPPTETSGRVTRRAAPTAARATRRAQSQPARATVSTKRR